MKKWKMKWKIENRNYIPLARPAAIGGSSEFDSSSEDDFNLSQDEEAKLDSEDRGTQSESCGWLASAKENLMAISRLQENWDGYGAAAPKVDIISAARRFISLLATRCLVASPVISPTRSGGVLFTWKNDIHRLEVQFISRDAASFAYLNTGTGKSERGALFTDSQDVRFGKILSRYFTA